MTLSLRDRQSSFFDVSFLASNLFDGKDPYSLFRRKVLPGGERGHVSTVNYSC